MRPRSRRGSARCCGVTRSHGSTTGTTGRESSRRRGATPARRRGRLPRRISHSKSSRPRTAATASMRPRAEGRGEPATYQFRDAPRRRASMRPRPEGRGEPFRCSRPHARADGFNAATARRPWRTRVEIGPQAARRQASMRPRPEGRGEPRCGVSGQGECSKASMRPRPEGRGEQRRNVRRRDPKAGFNAATARRPWRTAARSGSIEAAGASMRPRPEGRGEHHYNTGSTA